MKSEKIHLIGSKYSLELDAKFETDEGTHTYTRRGAHYEDGEYTERYYYEHFKGEGTIHSPGQEPQYFRFSTPKKRSAEKKTILQKVLPMSQGEMKRVVDEKLLVDFLCECIMESIKSQQQNRAMAMRYGLQFIFTDNVLNRELMIKQGVLAAENNQIQIALQ